MKWSSHAHLRERVGAGAVGSCGAAWSGAWAAPGGRRVDLRRHYRRLLRTSASTDNGAVMVRPLALAILVVVVVVMVVVVVRLNRNIIRCL